MNFRDQLSGFFWLVISIFVCVESIKSGVGTFRFPGPGFLPFWSGVGLGTLAIILVATDLLKEKVGRKSKNLSEGKKGSNVILVLVSLFAYALLLPSLGYLITTFGLMVFLFSLIGKPRLWIQGVSALITVLATYIIFYVWLDVRLPKGILGF
jgi:putative tricarboxylic transport membrane protein